MVAKAVLICGHVMMINSETNAYEMSLKNREVYIE
jgi:hypothetical protein